MLVIGRYYSSEEQYENDHSHKTTECYLEQVTANLCTIFQVHFLIVIQLLNLYIVMTVTYVDK